MASEKIARKIKMQSTGTQKQLKMPLFELYVLNRKRKGSLRVRRKVLKIRQNLSQTNPFRSDRAIIPLLFENFRFMIKMTSHKSAHLTVLILPETVLML